MNQESQSCCPVCTLYLRPGISLQDHLNTHPKKQVIKALLSLTNQINPINPIHSINPINLSKDVEKSAENQTDDSSSSSSSCHSAIINTHNVANNTDRSSPNSCPSPKSQNSLALSELRNDLEDNEEEEDIDVEVGTEDNNVHYAGDYPLEYEEEQPDSFQGESNESTQQREETVSSMTANYYHNPYQSNGHLIENDNYMSRYFYSSENARISHTDPDPQLHPSQYSTLATMGLHHQEYLSSNNHQEHQITLNIQTDELMPAHGELSGQESLEPPEPILASIWTMKSLNDSQPHTSTAWDDSVHEVSTAARNLMCLKNRVEIPKEEIIENKEVKPLFGKLICPYCKLKFDGAKARKAHIYEEHIKEEGVKKGLMYIKPMSPKIENDVDESEQQPVKVECSICNQPFENYLQMTMHFMDIHKGTKHKNRSG